MGHHNIHEITNITCTPNSHSQAYLGLMNKPPPPNPAASLWGLRGLSCALRDLIWTQSFFLEAPIRSICKKNLRCLNENPFHILVSSRLFSNLSCNQISMHPHLYQLIKLFSVTQKCMRSIPWSPWDAISFPKE